MQLRGRRSAPGESGDTRRSPKASCLPRLQTCSGTRESSEGLGGPVCILANAVARTALRGGRERRESPLSGAHRTPPIPTPPRPPRDSAAPSKRLRGLAHSTSFRTQGAPRRSPRASGFAWRRNCSGTRESSEVLAGQSAFLRMQLRGRRSAPWERAAMLAAVQGTVRISARTRRNFVINPFTSNALRDSEACDLCKPKSAEKRRKTQLVATKRDTNPIHFPPLLSYSQALESRPSPVWPDRRGASWECGRVQFRGNVPATLFYSRALFDLTWRPLFIQPPSLRSYSCD